jgi:hypothetical protein
MRPEKFGTLKGLQATILVYESYDEADKAAGKANAMLDAANASLAYRGPLADVREFIADLLEEKFGIQRKTKDTGKKDDAGNPILVVDEAPGDYVDRVCAAQGLSDLKQFQGEVDAWCAQPGTKEDGTPEPALAVSSKERERKAPKAPKLSNEMKELAKKLLAKHDDAKINKTFAKFLPAEQCNFARTGDETKDAETLGWLAKKYQQAKTAAGEL